MTIKKEKVSYLAEQSMRSDMLDVEGMLQIAIKELREHNTGLDSSQKAILIILDDQDERLDWTAYNANMKPSEIISLLAIVNQGFIAGLQEEE